MVDKKSSAKSLMSNILGGVGSNVEKEKREEKDSGLNKAFSHIEKKAKKKKTRMVTTMLVDPAKCKIQERPNRFYELLTPDNCADLIASIDSQGQKIPAIARQTGEADKPFEIFVGRRRHYVATHLGEELLIDVRSVTDEEAFLLSEAENEGREDLSDYEKACDWADALQQFYNGKVSRLATAINKTRPTVYLYLELASLDKRIIDAYSSPLDVKKSHATKLLNLMNDDKQKELIFKKAEELSGSGSLTGQAVFKELVKSGSPKKKRSGLVNVEKIMDANGKEAFTIKKSRKGGITIEISAKRELVKGELIKLLESAVSRLA